MHNPRRHRALARIAAIRSAERSAAHHELLLADAREQAAAKAREHADTRTCAAAQVWRDYLSGAAFQPEFACALASQVVHCADAGAAAHADEGQASEHREASEAAWRLGDVRCRQADQSLGASRRAAARDREERALEALADRVSLAWRRR